MIIDVTQQDIDKANADRRNADASYDLCKHCPISVAVKRITGRCDVRSAPGHFRWDNEDGNWYRYELPDVADEFIYAFDRRATVKPFTFEVDAPRIYPDNDRHWKKSGVK